jgi:Zn-dependent peptidase ImmA (M78 family)
VSLLERGFKTWSEKTSLGFRKDLNLPAESALDPRALAVKMGVIVWTAEYVAEQGGLPREHLDQLTKHDRDSWSAVTLVLPARTLIIINSTHVKVRQNSDIMHELSHLVLDHKPSRVDITPDGHMVLDSYDRKQEEEANWLAGSLLVPREPLVKMVRQRLSSDAIAEHFAVSGKMLQWRRQATGVDAQLARAGKA